MTTTELKIAFADNKISKAEYDKQMSLLSGKKQVLKLQREHLDEQSAQSTFLSRSDAWAMAETTVKRVFACEKTTDPDWKGKHIAVCQVAGYGKRNIPTAELGRAVKDEKGNPRIDLVAVPSFLTSCSNGSIVIEA